MDRIRNSLPPSAAGCHPMAAFWVHPKRSPEGRVRSISAVNGRTPGGPAAWVEISNREGSPESKLFIADIMWELCGSVSCFYL